MTIEAAILNLQDKLLALSGMKAAPDYPPEGAGAFPFGVSYERNAGTMANSDSFADDLAVIWCEIHVARQILPKAIQTAMAFRDPLLKALIADPTLAGSISTIRWPVLRTFGLLTWGGLETIGYRFEVPVKVLLTV